MVVVGAGGVKGVTGGQREPGRGEGGGHQRLDRIPLPLPRRGRPFNIHLCEKATEIRAMTSSGEPLAHQTHRLNTNAQFILGLRFR